MNFNLSNRRSFLQRSLVFFAGLTATPLIGRNEAAPSVLASAHSPTVSSEPFIGEIMLVPYNFAPRRWAICAGQLLLSCLILLVFTTKSFTQTTLVTGDIAFTGYNATPNAPQSDAFSFVLLTPVTAGTVIRFTDQAWGNDLVFNGTLGETTVSLTTTAPSLPAGTEIIIAGPPGGSATATLALGGSAGTCTGTTLSLSVNGDQVIAYQSAVANVAPFTFISGIHMNVHTIANGNLSNTDAANWENLPAASHTANSTFKPSVFITGTNAIWIGTSGNIASERNNARFSCTLATAGGANLNTAAGVRAACNNPAFWESEFAATGAVPTYPVPSGCTFITAPPAPNFTLQPANSTICAGSNTSFTVTANNASSLQWQVDNGGGFANITDNATYSGATTTTLNITATPGSFNGYLYRCVATNGSGSTNSNNATLTVVPLPVNPTLLVKTPATSTVADGTPVSATFNPGSGGTGCVDDYRYTINGGVSYLPYTPGSNISTTGLAAATGVVTIEGRRATCTSLCQASYIALVTWIVTPLPAGATTLNAGDLAFSAYAEATSEFSFVLLRNIGPGTVVNFTNNGWYITGTLRTGEETVTWTSNAAYAAGTEIKIAGLVATLALGGSAGTVTGTAGGLGLSATGDQILAYRGTAASPTFISAIHMNVYVGPGDPVTTTPAAWDGAASPSPAANTNASALPTGLSTGVNAIWIGKQGVSASEFRNAAYGTCAGPGTLGSIATLRAALNNEANWIRNNNSPLPLFPIPTGCPYLGVGNPPNITGQPANSAICELANTSFTVVAAGATSYQWQVDPGSGFVNITNNITYSGATTATLGINAAGLNLNGYLYRCIATNGSGSSISNNATLTVNAIPIAPTLLTRTPIANNVADGTPVSATFSPGGGGTGCTDDFRYTTDGGITYLPYTPGSNISTTGIAAGSGWVFIEGRRAGCSSGCQGVYKVLALWYITPLPAAPTTLNAGDVAFSAYAATTDEFSFVLIKNIGAGTVINFTTNGWYSSNTFRTGEETVTWTAPAGGLTAGTEIKIAGLVATRSGAGAAGTVAGTPLTINPTGDQILAYRGTTAAPTFITAIHMNVYTLANADPTSTTAAAWDGAAYASPAINVSASALPTGLTTGVNAIWIGTQDVLSSEFQNAAYGNCAGSGVLGPLTGLRVALNNQANWVRNNNPAPGFSIPTGCNYLSVLCPAISVTNPVNLNGSIGVPFSETFTSAGGAPTVTFSTSSALPGGLTLSTAGVLSGTPTASGIFPIIVRATDGNGCTGDGAAYNLQISACTITLTSAVGTNAQTVCVNTAITPITYSTTGATGATFSGLPAGVTGSWAANVVTITGTPTTSVGSPFNYTVTPTGGCGALTATGTITVNAANTITLSSAPGTNTQTVCINTAIINITYNTTGATGATFSGLPAGVTGTWLANVVTISGTPTTTVGSPFSYTVDLTGGCGTINAPGTITVNPVNTVTLSSAPGTDAQTVAINTPITNITYNTTGATGATVTGLPPGVTGSWAANVVTISGSPTSAAGSPYTYTVTLTDGCGTVTTTGTITVTTCAVTLTSPPGTNNQTVCNNTPITNITYATVGATGSTFSGLPAGVTGNWVADVITISGTPTTTVGSPFNYTITQVGGSCTGTTATGTITVNPNNTITLTSAAGTNAQTVCINTPITNITYSTTGATGATFSGLPAGVTGAWAANVVTISGSPTTTVGSPFSYTVTLTGGCGTVTTTGTITVNPLNTITLTSGAGTNAQTVAINSAITNITYATTGATGATFSGLPTGVTGNWAANVVSISGSPSTAVGSPFSYTVTLTGGCGKITATGSIAVNPCTTPTVTCTGNIALNNTTNTCGRVVTYTTTIGGTPPTVTYAFTGATTASGSGDGSGSTFNVGVTNVTVTATNTCMGNALAVCSFSVNITDNQPPNVTAGTIGSCYPTVAAAQAAAIAATTATDNCPGVVTKTASTVGTCSAVITVTATDANSNATAVTYNTRIDNTAPTVTVGTIGSCYPTVAAAEAAALAATSATDNCPDALTEVASTVGTCSAVVTVTTTDGCGNATAVTYNTRIDNTAPTVTVGTISSCYPTVAAAEAAALAATSATDNCPDALTEVASTAGTCSAVVTVTTTDGCGNATAVTYNTRIDNTAPTVTVGTISSCYPTVAAAEAAALAATSATDNCPNALTEVASTVGTCSAVVSVTTTDGCGNATAVTYNTRIDNTAPTVTVGNIGSCYPTVAAAEAAALAATSATDNCPGALTEVASTVGTCSAVVTVTTTDGCGNATAVTYNTRIDNTAPTVTVGTISSCYPTVAAAEAAALAATSATDNCPGALTEVASTVGTCSAVVTVTTTDGCGNATAVTYNTRIDNTAPTVTVGTISSCYPTVAAAEAAALAATSATDNCPGTLTEVASTVGICSAVVTVTTTDGCGNATAVTYNTRIDNTAPTVTVGTISSCYPTVAAAEAAALAATSATDNCPGALTEVASTVGTCSAVVTVITTDGCGNATAVTYNTRIDNTAPTVTVGTIGSCYPTVAAAEAAALAVTSATDNCPGALTEVASTVGTCSAVVTVMTTDGCGNATAVTYNTRIDDTAPTVTVGTISSCYPTVAAAEAAALAATSATDNCPGALTEVASTVGTCSAVVTVTTTDGCGNATAVTYNTRIDNTAPTVTVGTISSCYPTVAAAEAAALTATSATDNCPGALTEVASTVGTCSAIVTVTTTDGCGNATAVTYNTRIDNTAPTVTVGTISSCYPTVAAAEAAALAATSATDNCPGALTEVASTVGTCSAVVTVTTTDGCGNATAVTYNTRIDNTAPTVTVGTISSCYPTVAAAEAAALTATSATDNCPDALTEVASTAGTCSAVVTVTTTDGCGNATAVTYNTRIDNTAPTVTAGTIGSCYPTVAAAEAAALAATSATDNCPGALTEVASTVGTCSAVVTVTTTDGCGNATAVTYNTRIDNTAPTVTMGTISSCYPTVAAAEAAALAATSATDNCPGALTEVASTVGTCSAVITVTTTDGCGNATAVTYNTRIDNTAPTVTVGTISSCYPTVAAAEAAALAATSATDNCPGALTEVASTVGTCSAVITVTTTDGCGNATAVTYNTRIDNTAPAFTRPADKTIFYDATVGACSYNANPSVTGDVLDESDACSMGLNATYSDATSSGTLGSTIIKRTWSLVDGCGNKAADQIQTITVQDNIKPTITCPPSQTIALGSFECSRVVTFSDPSVSDNCSATSARVDNLQAYASGSSYTPGTYNLKYRATDRAGNFADCEFSIQVNGQLTTGRLKCLPTLTVSLDERQCINTLDATGLLIDNTYYCANSYRISIPNRTDNYLTSADLGKTLTVTVSDNFNNSCSTVVTVVDTKAPVLNTPQDTSISCAELDRDGRILTTLGVPSIIYECSKTTFTFFDRTLVPPTGQATFTTRPDGFPTDKNFDFSAAYASSKIIVRTYTATDAFNNSSTIQRVIYVRNISLTQVQCPKDVVGTCVQGNFNSSIQATGTPILSNGRLLQDVSCGIDYFYSDERTTTTQGYVIKRAWTLVDRRTQERQTCVQTITVTCAAIPLASISGSINKETGESVTAMVKIMNPTEMMTEMQGSSYVFNNLTPSNSYRIQPERDNDVMNGVTTFDIALLSKHVLDIQPLTSPYQMIAADVNRDGEIDGSDMLLIRNLILRRIARFPNNTAWRFIPKNFVFRDNKNPFADDFPEVLNYNNLNENINKADFVAVKVGDVNLTAKANAQALANRTARPIENIYLTDKKMEAGKEYIFDVNIKNSTLVAIQLALKIDKSNVTSFSVQNGNLPEWGSGNIEINEKEGIIAAAWANTPKGSLLDENSIIQLKITPRQSAWLHELVSLDAQNMENLAYDTDPSRLLGEGGIEKELQLKFDPLNTENPEFALHQNRPNPFIAETTISFILPETGKAELSIYDVNGRVVYTTNKTFNKGYNEVKLDNTVLKNAGIYFYRLQSDKFTATKRMQFFIN